MKRETPKPIEDPAHVKTAKNLTLRGLTNAQVKQLSNSLYKLYRKTEKFPGKEWTATGHPVREHIRELWSLAYNEERRRNEDAAEKKDKGEVLFAFCTLRDWIGHEEFIRTPNRMIHRRIYSMSMHDGSNSESISLRTERGWREKLSHHTPSEDFEKSIEVCRKQGEKMNRPPFLLPPTFSREQSIDNRCAGPSSPETSGNVLAPTHTPGCSLLHINGHHDCARCRELEARRQPEPAEAA